MCGTHVTRDAGRLIAANHRVAVGVAQALLYEIHSDERDVYADPLPPETLSRVDRRATSAEWVKHYITLVTASRDDPLQQCERLLRGIAQTLRCLRVDRWNVSPDILLWHPGRVLNVEL